MLQMEQFSAGKSLSAILLLLVYKYCLHCCKESRDIADEYAELVTTCTLTMLGALELVRAAYCAL